MSVRLIYASATTAAAAGLAYYTYRVEERRLERERTATAFRRPMVGSVDDSLADQLNPGDIVVFERDCSALHFPYAAHCMATKLLLRDSLDHVGVVFTDRATRLPAVLEAVPWQGMQVTPFQQRVSNGLDFRIVVVPLVLPLSTKPDDSAAMRTKRVHQRVNNFCNGASSSTSVPTKVQVRSAPFLRCYRRGRDSLWICRMPAALRKSRADLPYLDELERQGRYSGRIGIMVQTYTRLAGLGGPRAERPPASQAGGPCTGAAALHPRRPGPRAAAWAQRRRKARRAPRRASLAIENINKISQRIRASIDYNLTREFPTDYH